MTTPEPEPEPKPERLSTVALGPLLIALTIALGPGLALWAWTRSEGAAVLLDNLSPAGESPWQALAWAGGSAVIVGMIYVWVGSRADEPRPVLRRLNRVLSPLAASIVLPLLYVAGIEHSRHLLVSFLIVVFAATLGLCVHTAWPWLRERVTLTRIAESPWAPPAALALMLFGHCVMMIQLGIVRHQALGSRIFDLGIFDNLLFHAAAGHWQTTSVLKGGTFTSAHCAPILQLLAPIYALAPGPQTLIVIQVVWVASGAIPLYLLATHVFEGWSARRWLGVVFGLGWLCHPSLHGVSLFDFHALTLAAPTIVWAIYALERGRAGLWAVAIILLLLTREDLAFVVIALSLFAFTEGRRAWAGLTLVAAVASLAVVKLVFMEHPDIFMPDSESSYRYANRFSQVIPDPETGGVGDIVATVVSNPGFMIQHTLVPAKLDYLCVLALPTLGLFVFGRRALWALSFGLVFIALASGTNLHNMYLHYTVFVFPPMAAAAVLGLRNLVARVEADQRARLLAAIAVTMSFCALLAGDRFGAFTDSGAFRAGNVGLIRALDGPERERYAWVREAAASIPASDSVAATHTLGPHVSSRAQIYNFRHHKRADWLLLRLDEVSGKDLRMIRRRVRAKELERVASWGKELVLYRER